MNSKTPTSPPWPWNIFKNWEQETKSKWITQSCPTLCDPMDCSLPASSIYEIFQARVLEWVAISFSAKYNNKSCYHVSHHSRYSEGSRCCKSGIIEEDQLYISQLGHLNDQTYILSDSFVPAASEWLSWCPGCALGAGMFGKTEYERSLGVGMTCHPPSLFVKVPLVFPSFFIPHTHLCKCDVHI